MTGLKHSFEALRADERGAVAIMFGLSFVILLTIAGLAVDSSRVYNVNFKVRESLDAAALAAAKLLDDEYASDAQFQTIGEAYVNAYIKRISVDDVKIQNVKITPDRTVGSVTAQADVSMPALFGRISAAVTNFTFTPTATVIYKPRKIELALVLDITGSMCDAPPFNAADACSSGAKLSALKDAAKDMVDALATTDPAPGAIRVSIAPYSASLNAGTYAAMVSGSASIDGCVVERTGGGAYTDGSPSGSGALGTSSTADNPSYSCPTADVLPLTDVATNDNALRQRINDLRGFGGTAGHIGLAWGWYTVSPSWSSIWPSSSRPQAYNKDKTIKAIVLMTDGMFNTAYRNGGENYAWPDTATADPSKPGTSSYQALKICENIRGRGEEMQIYTVGFQTPPEAEALLKECSGAANFFNAGNASQLSEAFKTIANKLTIMRVSG